MILQTKNLSRAEAGRTLRGRKVYFREFNNFSILELSSRSINRALPPDYRISKIMTPPSQRNPESQSDGHVYRDSRKQDARFPVYSTARMAHFVREISGCDSLHQVADYLLLSPGCKTGLYESFI